ncbi:MAG: hypothetical protein VKK04_25800 [Synechococcales bacterium]|nr:hypothetical protein [Synechococcales bacterium]
MPTPSLKLIIDWRNAVPNVPADQRERQTQDLYKLLRNTDEASYVQRLYSSQTETGLMGDNLLVEILFATVPLDRLADFYETVRQYLPDIPIQFELEANGQKRTVQLTGDRPKETLASHSDAGQLMQAAHEIAQP